MQASPDLAGAIKAHREYVMGETLTVEMLTTTPPYDAAAAQAEFDGESVAFAIKRA